MRIKSSYTPSGDRYWANEGPDDIAAAVSYQWRRYQKRLRDEGRVRVWQAANIAYHGRNPDGGYANAHAITFGGDEGEVAQLHMGHFRRHVNGRIQMAVGQRPAFEVTARNNDPESISSVEVARQVLEYDLDEGDLEEQLKEAHVRQALYGEGYVVQTWDVHAGDVIAVEPVAEEAVDGTEGLEERQDGQLAPVMREIREGDVRTLVRSPLDVARDLSLDSTERQPWYIVRDRVHRWEIVRRYPEDEEIRRAILEAQSAERSEYRLFDDDGTADGESDYVERLTLYHMPTDAIPQGRIVEVIAEHVLPGSDIPYTAMYDHCVVHRDIPSPETDRATGYCDNWDLLAPTQALDAVESTVITLLDAGSSVNWIARKSEAVEPKDLTPQLKLIEYDDELGNSDGPRLMERIKPEQSDYQASDHYQSHLQKLSGQNPVVMGDPQANIESGNFAALVAAMAVQAATPEIAAYGRLLRSVFNGRLRTYRRHLEYERTIELTGRDKQAHVRVFKGADLDGVRRVRVEVGSPMTRTLQGKMDFAKTLFEMYGPQGMPLHRFLSLVHHGRLDDIDPTAIEKHKVLARRENDMFRNGQGSMVQALKTDHHECHIAEHLEQINDEQFRYANSPERIAALQQLLAHVSEHHALWQQTAQMEPGMLAATGQQPPPPTVAPGVPPAQPDGPPGGSQALPPGGGNPAAGPSGMPGGALMEALAGNEMPQSPATADQIPGVTPPPIAGQV